MRSSLPTLPRRPAAFCALLIGLAAGPASGQAPGTPVPAPLAGARQVPEALNFANGLFRDRRYDLAAEEYEGFLRTTQAGPDADDARFGLANARLFLGRYKEARQAFEAFLKAAPKGHPNASTALFRVGETAYLLGDLPAAQASLEKFLAENPGHRHEETAWSHAGDVALRLEDLPRARRAYEKVLSKPGGRLAARARLGLARVLASQGETEAAVKTLDELVATGGPEWSDRARYEIGRTELAAGRLDRAVSALEGLEKASPKSPLVPESKLRRAEALGKLDRRDEAEALLKTVSEGSNPNLAAQAADALGGSLLARGKAAEALATLDEASSKFAATSLGPLLKFHAAEAAQALSKLDEARARFLKIAESAPDDPLADDALVRAAGIALEARDYAAAKTLAKSLPAKFPRTDRLADAHLIEARVALVEKDAKGAIALLETALGPDKPGPATAQAATYYLGLAYRADGQSARANELLDKLAKTPAASTAAGAQFMLGQGLIESGKFAEAIPPLEAYLKGQPEGEVADFALAHLARAQLELGRPDEARATVETLATKFPKSKALPAARLGLAESAMSAKQYDRAAEFFRQAAESADP
ncbi:MAG TPA: tetratricopeptide repeat protein, partial [Isosphaeraceae bacterium]